MKQIIPLNVSAKKEAAARGQQLIDLRLPVGEVSINAFGVTNPIDPKSGGTVLDSARLNANEMARRATAYAEEGF